MSAPNCLASVVTIRIPNPLLVLRSKSKYRGSGGPFYFSCTRQPPEYHADRKHERREEAKAC
jgi:hypothetical protein